MEDEAKNFVKAWLVVLASLCYSYFFASKIPKGILRFFSLLPIFTLFTLLPLALSRPIPNVILGGFITWLSNFKLLLYSFNLGPLSTNYPQNSFLRFIFIASFPIKIKDQKQVNPSKVQHYEQKGSFENEPHKVLRLNFWSKLVLFAILDVIYHNTKNMVLLCSLMYLFIDIVFGVCDILVRLTLGIELEQPSNEPYLSTSLQDFWGKRWNRMISDALRQTIFKPVRSTLAKLVGHTGAIMLGVMAVFLVSGLMHELIFYYVTRVPPTWEVTWFFVGHGVCVVLEMGVKRFIGNKWRLHWALSIPLTLAFVMGTGFWLFFPQIMRNHVDVKVQEDVVNFGKYLRGVIIKE